MLLPYIQVMVFILVLTDYFIAILLLFGLTFIFCILRLSLRNPWKWTEWLLMRLKFAFFHDFIVLSVSVGPC